MWKSRCTTFDTMPIKKLIENLLLQLVSYKLVINKKTHTGLNSFLLIAEFLSKFQTDVNEESQTKNQIDVHEENVNEHGSSLILENSILPISINTPNSSYKTKIILITK